MVQRFTPERFELQRSHRWQYDVRHKQQQVYGLIKDIFLELVSKVRHERTRRADEGDDHKDEYREELRDVHPVLDSLVKSCSSVPEIKL